MEYNASNDRIAADIDRYVNGTHAARNREILKARLIDGYTYEELAARFDMSVAQIKRVVYKTSSQLFRNVSY